MLFLSTPSRSARESLKAAFCPNIFIHINGLLSLASNPIHIFADYIFYSSFKSIWTTEASTSRDSLKNFRLGSIYFQNWSKTFTNMHSLNLSHGRDRFVSIKIFVKNYFITDVFTLSCFLLLKNAYLYIRQLVCYWLKCRFGHF